METFNDFFRQPVAQSHLYHLEELPLVQPFHQGLYATYQHLSSVLSRTMGEPMVNRRLTIKYDGAPAVIFGRDPKTNDFFLGTKSALNTMSPKRITKYDDIAVMYKLYPALVRKLQQVWLNIDQDKVPSGWIAQGDVLYTLDSLTVRMMDDHPYYTFQPNVLMYGIDVYAPEAATIRGSNLGLAIHTEYLGDSFSSLKARPVDRVITIGSKIWQPPLNANRYTIPTKKEFATIADVLAVSNLQNLDSSAKWLMQKPIADMYLKAYNRCIREHQSVTWPLLLEALTDNGTPEEDWANVEPFFQWQERVTIVKHILLKHVVETTPLEVYRPGDDRMKETSHEGVVSIVKSHPVKLVNRLEFSALNFRKSPFRQS